MSNTKQDMVAIRSPFVTQADRFAVSLKRMADTFLRMEETKESFSVDEIREMCESVVANTCESCSKRGNCYEQNQEKIYQQIYNILKIIEEYGVELNVETKRSLQRECIRAPKFLREILKVFQEAKQRMLWENRIIQHRENCAMQLDAFAQTVQSATRELDASIFQDKPLERKIQAHLKRSGIKMLSSVFFITAQGRYEIHLTLKAEKGVCLSTRTVARLITECVGRKMCPSQNERPVVGQEYGTMVFVEGPRYHVLHGIARASKEQQISGDNYVRLNLPGGKEAFILSDGMGTGERASRESGMIVEMLEELLVAGFPQETALSMINTALVMGREEVCFSTVDMCSFDLYTGECKVSKAGAAMTFIRTKEGMEHIYSDSLPLGVVAKQQMKEIKFRLTEGDMIVMVTDGILDALPSGKQEELLDLIIGGSIIENPQELAEYILEKIQELSAEESKDDMTILVAGIWAL